MRPVTITQLKDKWSVPRSMLLRKKTIRSNVSPLKKRKGSSDNSLMGDYEIIKVESMKKKVSAFQN